MNDAKALLHTGALVAHGVAAVTLVLLAFQTQSMAIFCIVAGALIGCAGVPAVPDRPITLYVAFGVLMGYSFWMAVSAINQRALLSMVLVLLLVAGAVWLLKQPSWPSALFRTLVAVLFLGIAVLQYRRRNQIDDFDPDHIRHSAITTLVVLTVGLVYVGLGFAQFSWDRPRKRRRRRPAAPRTDLEE